ncbi:MAG: GNAT family N-acetyltransferase [Flavobacteriales bacterium]|nr:GNAT family N-acetyltransferase [Flavobacteriales bacterium]
MKEITKKDSSPADKKVGETNRLILMHLQESDYPFILELLNSPSWIRYIGNKNIKTKAEAKKYILNGPVKSYEENDFGLYKLCLKEDLTPVGICGLVKRDELTIPDLGYALLENFHGKRYAYEASEWVLNIECKKLKIKKILAIVSDNNKRSIQLLEGHGFVYRKKHSFKLANNISLYCKTFL